ncbi:hypothetical protein [Bradyrhizobium ottawaense]|uniref:hypothetical protein n=1 Tax=Bradyrhizobium ottawaense TaxID=931866 RepID=UPI000BE86817|nr:hypothetical protein [Bradyrhizobium ottawaense]
MGLSSITLERFTCDRCEKAEDIPCGNTELRAKWGHASAQGYQGKQLFWLDYKITLCPECCASLQDWAAARPSLASDQRG